MWYVSLGKLSSDAAGFAERIPEKDLDEGSKGMLSKVLIPTDGSETARKAMDFAARLLAGSSCEVVLLAVVEEPAYATFWSDGLVAPEVILPPTEELKEELRGKAEETLSAEAESLRAAGLRTTVRLRFGNPATEILQEAEDGGYEMIVMGSHGRGVLGGFLLGSVSNRVVHHAKCPVLVVRG